MITLKHQIMNPILEKQITTEYEGVYSKKTIGDIIDWLMNIKEISISLSDFHRKVTYGLTDESSILFNEDYIVLTEFYYAKL